MSEPASLLLGDNPEWLKPTHSLSYVHGNKASSLILGSFEECVEHAISHYGMTKDAVQRLIDGDEIGGLVLSEVE